MNLKKILLLSSMALAAIAFAVPATASATNLTWTDDHVHIAGDDEFTQGFEGPLSFDTPFGSFGCEEVTVAVVATSTGATIEEFKPTTNTCTGTGAFVNCELTNDTFNTPWQVSTTTTDLVVTKTGGDIEIHNFYGEKNGQPCGVGSTTSSLFGSIAIVPELDGEGTIKALEIGEEQKDTTGNITATGFVTPENGPTLGLT